MDHELLTPETVCKTVLDTYKMNTDRSMSARPWNRFDEQSLWWLIPSTTDWPAYHLAKWFFRWSPKDRSTLEVGLHVEKGLSPKLREAYPSKAKSFLSSDWAWFKLLKDTAAPLHERLRYLTSLGRAGIEIEGGYVTDPAAFDDPYRLPRSAVRLMASPDGSIHLDGEGSRRADGGVDVDGALLSMKRVRKVEEIVPALRKLEENGWLWVDVLLFAEWPIEGETVAELASTIWKKQLAHALNWL